jgi:hypothetical protein
LNSKEALDESTATNSSVTLSGIRREKETPADLDIEDYTPEPRNCDRQRGVQEHTALGVRYNHVSKRFAFAVAIGLAAVGAVLAGDNAHALPRFPISVPGLPPRRVPVQP